MTKIGRNDLCPCGSKKKHKKCCLLKESTEDRFSAITDEIRPVPEHFRLQWVSQRKITDQATLIGEVNIRKHGREIRPRIRIMHFDFGNKEENDTAISAATNIFGPDTVLVSDGFKQLPPLLKEAVIWHEIGHFYHDHFNRYESSVQERKDYIGSERVHPRELEADDFAVSKVGKEVVEEMLRFMIGRDCNDAAAKREFEMRLAYLTESGA